MDRSYFSTLFTRCFGLPPSRYVLWQRVEAVQRLLIETDWPLEALASETGFCDAFHLSKTFKRLTGISPRTYRVERAKRQP